jgi:hypothetical protein
MHGQVRLAEALGKLNGPERSVRLFAHGSLQAKMYAPVGIDDQTPHEQDEIYLIARGTGTFTMDGKSTRRAGRFSVCSRRSGAPLCEVQRGFCDLGVLLWAEGRRKMKNEIEEW